MLGQADALQIDVHKIATCGASAGGGEINYLTWVYHALPGNADRYTPVAMDYANAQLIYPVNSMRSVRSRSNHHHSLIAGMRLRIACVFRRSGSSGRMEPAVPRWCRT